MTYWIGGQKSLDQGEVQRKLDNLLVPGFDGPAMPGLPNFDLGPPPKIQ